MSASTFSTAFKLHTLGFSVVPSGGGDSGKVPLVNWSEYQSRRPTEAELDKWNTTLKPRLWGTVTGAISGVFVVDADNTEARAILESNGLEPHVVTPRGGGHYYFRHPGHLVKTEAGVLPKIDIRGDGGFVNIVGSNKDGEYRIAHLPTPDNLYTWEKLPAGIRDAMDNGNKPSLPATAPVDGSTIPEGQRNAHLTSLAGSMRRRGMAQAAIEAALIQVNKKQCRPPLSNREVLTIAKSVSRYEPSPESSRENHFNPTDYGNAERLVSLYGDIIRYSPERRLWLIWTDKVWEWDIGSVRIAELAKRTTRSIYREAADEADDEQRETLAKHARGTERQARIDAMVKSTESEPGIAVNLAELDTHQLLLNVNNGTIDLKTGKLKPHDRSDLITEIIPIDYDPKATNAELDDFLHRIFNDDIELIAYVHRALGYSITGDQSEQAFFFCYGSGFNGKSTLLNACSRVLGDYATEVPPNTFMVDKFKRSGPDEAVASIKNKRLVCCTELEDGQKLSVSLVKRMTGGESLWCERKYERGYNFQPTHKLWLSGNHEPVITDSTNSIWRRLKKIPFTVEIPEADRKKGYAEYLAQEYPKAILAWLVCGAVEWHKLRSLGEPQIVKRAVEQYQADQDLLHDFLLERCILQKNATIDQKSLYADYKQWAEYNDLEALGKLKFRARLIEKGIVVGTGNANVKTWRGIRLRTGSNPVTLGNFDTNYSGNQLREQSTDETLPKTGNQNNTNNTGNSGRQPC